GQFCDADLEVAFRRNTCFIRDLDGVDLFKGNRSINLYTINLYDMASVSPICLMARATPTKSWLWHQRLSHLNFDTINDLAKNDIVFEVIKNFLKKIYVRLQAPVIIVRTNNGTEFKNYALKEYFTRVSITHETSAAKTPQQNGVVERRNRTLVEAARTMLIFSHVLLFLWAEAIATAALCYPKNDREDIGKLGAKDDIGVFIGYSANSNLQAPSASMSIQDFAPTPTNSSNTPISSHNVDEELQPHVQQQGNHTLLPTASAVDNVSNVIFEGDLFINPFATPST
nr:integrase, catalytic region, zinc finger, CCHC-type, peptidase aspartic, catalytic [Tanacetum cinerariifolium]